MDLAQCFFKRMAPGADAIDRVLVADETGAAWISEPRAIDLRSVKCVNVQIDQPCGRMSGFKSDADLLDRDGIGIDPEDEVGAQ